MAKLDGNEFVFILGANTVDQTDMIGISWTTDAEKSESTGVADAWDTFESDIIKGCSGHLDGYYRGGAAREAGSLRKALFDAWEATGHSATFSIRPSGTGSTKRTLTGTMILDQMPMNFAMRETSTMSCDFTVNGALGDAAQ